MPQHSKSTIDTPPNARQRRQSDRHQTTGNSNRSNASRRSTDTSDRPIAKSLQEYGRGIAGGILFSLPLLYTMEVWWGGFSIHPWRLVAAVLATLVLLLGYNRYAGLRRDASIAEVAIDSVEELGIGLLISTTVLWLLGRITLDMPVNEVVGKIVVEALIVAIGVSVGTAQLGGGNGENDDTGMEGDDQSSQPGKATGSKEHQAHFIGQNVLAFCGAVLIAANVAPTEEIIMLAVETSPWKLLGLMLVSILLSALILFYSDFKGAQHLAPAGEFVSIVVGGVTTYAIALAASAMLLWFFGSFDGYALITCLGETVVLGVAAALGASAGRLLLQTNNQG